jgi:hypothetical protein
VKKHRILVHLPENLFDQKLWHGRAVNSVLVCSLSDESFFWAFVRERQAKDSSDAGM